MTTSNRLIILRDGHKYSQQFVADYIGVSKATYFRYEKGTAIPSLNEINALLKLYSITFEDFMGINLPISHTLSYPSKLLDNLEKILQSASIFPQEVPKNQETYSNIEKALEPLLSIREKAFHFPDLDLTEIPRGTTLKEISFDCRGECLIDKSFTMLSSLYKEIDKGFKAGYNR